MTSSDSIALMQNKIVKKTLQANRAWRDAGTLLLLVILSACTHRTAERTASRSSASIHIATDTQGNYLGYLIDDDSIVMRKEKYRRGADKNSPSIFEMTSEKPIRLDKNVIMRINRMMHYFDSYRHDRQMKELAGGKLIEADGPYYMYYLDGKLVAQGWTPELESMHLLFLSSVIWYYDFDPK